MSVLRAVREAFKGIRVKAWRFRPRWRSPGVRARQLGTVLAGPGLLASGLVAPFSVAAASAVAVTAAGVAHAAPAQAASGSVLILSTSVNGGSSSAEAQAVPAGYTVTVASPANWDAMTTTQFKAYSLLIIGDPSSGGSCATTVPADALSTAGTWGPAVTGNVALLGTAPALAGNSGQSLITDSIGYALAGGGTGLYVSLNCEYATAAGGTAVPLLASVDGGGFAVTGQSSSCPNAGTVNSWEAQNAGSFAGLRSSALGSWASPACSVQETVNTWPAGFTPVGYDSAASPADFTASDGATGQPYVLAGATVSAATAALAPSTGGEVPAGTAIGGGQNQAAPGVSQSSAGDAADPVNTENGDFSQSATDLNIPTFGPALTFTRTYDAMLAQQQTQAGAPGPLGYGWTDNWSSSLTTARPVPGDAYTLSGLRTNNGDGGPATSAPLDSPDGVQTGGGNVYIADSADNRVQEIAGSSGTQWGISMTAGDVYTIAGSASGASGRSPDGTAASSALLNDPESVVFDSAGNLYIADSGNNRVLEVPKTSGTQRGISMTAGDIYTIAGHASGAGGHSGDGGAATSAFLSDPIGVATGFGTSDIYIADSGNNRIQEVPAASGTQWGVSMTANDIYTVAGSAAGNAGRSGNGGAATSALLNGPEGVKFSSGGDMYIADTGNNRIQEVPNGPGTQWGVSMTANDIYTVAGSATGVSGHSGNGGAATSALLSSPIGIAVDNGTQLYIADSGNNRVQEVARTTHTEWGVSMTANDIYTIAGSASGAGGFAGDGGAATSARLNSPAKVSLDGSFNLYIADSGNNRIREITASAGQISTIAGTAGTLANAGDGGPATTAALSDPDGVAADASGNVYIADSGNNRVQEIAATSHTQWGIAMTAGDTYTIAGSPTGAAGSSGDGGPATSARLNLPIAVAVDPAGDVYVTDFGNNRIQEIAAATGTQRGQSMTANDIYTVAGSATGASGTSGDSGPATSALLNMPWGLSIDSAGDIYVADENNNRIQEVAGATGTQWGVSMTANDIYTVAGSAAGAPGSSGDGGAATSALLTAPTGVVTDPAGNLYVTDDGNNRVQEVAFATGPQRGLPSMTAHHIYTIAGSAAGASGTTGDGGPATSALLSSPIGIAADTAGDLYVTDNGNNRVQEIAAANGTQWGVSMTANDVYTVAGSTSGASGVSGDGGPAASALLNSPIGIAADPSGSVFLTDNFNNRIREVTATAATALAPYPLPAGITVNQPDGSQVTFFPQSGGTCTAPYVKAGGYCALPQDVGATLTFDSGTSTYTFSPSPGTSYTYASNGVLTGQSDAAGNTLAITYGSPTPGTGNCPATAFTCDAVTAASGRALTVGTNPAGLVTSVTDPMGLRWTYGYTGSDLTKVTDPMGDITSYTYGQGSTGNALLVNDLLTITDPNGQPGGPDGGADTVNVYDSSGRVIRQTDPSGFTTSFSYCVNAAAGDCLNAATGNGYVTVTDPDGDATVYDYVQGTMAAQANWNGAPGSAAVYEEDYLPSTSAAGPSGGTLLNQMTIDANGNTSAYAYDSAGDITSTTEPGSNGTPATTTTAFTGPLAQPSCFGAAEAQAAANCTQNSGPAPVAPGGVITPPSSAPPLGLTYTLHDTAGNELYSTTGVYEPGATTAAYAQTTYQLFKGNTITLGGKLISCSAPPPPPSLPCATIDENGIVTQLAYDAQGDMTSSATPDGNGAEVATTTFGYDGDGEQLTEVAPDGNVTGGNAGNYTTTTAYNADGQETSVTSGGGSGHTETPRTISYGYDADGNQTTVKDPRGFTTTAVYNAGDKPALVTDPAGNSTLTCYDGVGNVAQTVPPTGVAVNNLTAKSCPASYPAGYTDRLTSDATNRSFNSLDELTALTTPAPAGQSAAQTTTYSYDSAGNLVTMTAPPTSNGGPAAVTTYTHNAAGDMASQTTGSGTSAASTTSYCYDPDGNRTSVVMPDGNISGVVSCETSSPYAVSASSFPTQAAYQTTSAYDSADELVSTTAPATSAVPGGATTTSTYDPAGNLLTGTDPNGVTTTRTYTPADLPATVSYSGSSAHSVTYGYDADGNQTQMTDATGTSSYGYDSFGELTSATNGAGQTTGYGYSADGQVNGITYPLPSGATWAATDTVSYGYNNADHLTSVTDFGNHQITVTPNADGLPGTVALGSTGDAIATSYAANDVPSAITLKNSTSTLQSFSYADAPAGSILSETDTPASSASPAVYTYDARNQVTSVTPGTGSTLSYAFDPSGDLTILPNGAAGTYDHASELTSSALSGTTTSYTYNADGEQLSSAQGGTTLSTGSWNGAGQLSSYDSTAGDMTAATYDGNGLRVVTTIAPSGQPVVTQGYVWDPLPAVPQLLMDGANAYIYAGDGTTPAEQVSLSNGAVTYLVADSLGSVRGTISAAGSLTGTTSYDAWGNPRTAGGLTAATPFGFAGSYTDPTGLIYLLNRYYNPAAGQFTSVDPEVADTLSPYAYAANDPVSITDPTGLVRFNWWDYETKMDTGCVDTCFDFGFNYSVQMSDAIARTDAKTIAKHIVKWTKYLPVLATVIGALVARHPYVAAIVSGILVYIATITEKSWVKAVSRFIRWIKRVYYGKGKHVGFYAKIHFNDFLGSHFDYLHRRYCPNDTSKCGSKGAHIWNPHDGKASAP